MGISRIWELRAAIGKNGLDALLISQPENRRYLSGFTGSSGWLLISQQHAILATDSRYTEQAKEEALDFELIQTKGELHDWLLGLVSDLGWHKLGFEASFVSYDSYHKLAKATRDKQLKLDFIPTSNLVEHLRMVKEPEELKLIIEAAELVDKAFEYIKSLIHPGMKESGAAWEIEKFLRQNGSEEMPFELIVTSGPNSALPHGRPTERTIHPGEPVLIDIGARISGYCSDFSRTICLGKELKTESYQLSAIYDIVLKAQTTAIEGIESGMNASQVDQLARIVIKQAGYGDAFGHNLGHGVGLAVHELPGLASNSSDLLLDGMVFTIEPGIYIPGWGGVRVEDMVVLENGKAKLLTRSEMVSFQLSATH